MLSLIFDPDLARPTYLIIIEDMSCTMKDPNTHCIATKSPVLSDVDMDICDL